MEKLSFIIIILLLGSCTRSTSNKVKKSTDNQTTSTIIPYVPPTGTGTGTGSGSGSLGEYPYGQGYPPSSIPMGESYGNGNEPGVANNGMSTNYFKLNGPPIVVHGAGSGTVVWSSDTDMPSGVDQDIFKTDARFNVRVVPRVQSYGVDSKGQTCPHDGLEYTKLNVGVRIRKPSTTYGDYYQFQNVRVNGASKVHEFSVPTGNSEPYVIDIMNVEWDYSCIYYALDGYHNIPSACPFDNVWSYDCVSFELQFSTDFTKDLPGTRTY